MKKKQMEPFFNYFYNQGINFDGIYKRKRRYKEYFHDYNQILYDFKYFNTILSLTKVAVFLILDS